MNQYNWTIGVDLGGTKIETALVDDKGQILERERHPTPVDLGPDEVQMQIVSMVSYLLNKAPSGVTAVGVGVAGQIEAGTGTVTFAPNLQWQNVPLQANLKKALDLPVVVINDVRAATWGEWLDGAGRGCDDLVCLFVGTGIGGGVVSGGRMLTGSSNTAGELGHMTVDLHGPPCTCGNRGCLEALAGGWAIARRARQAVSEESTAGAKLLDLVGNHPESITAQLVIQAAQAGDSLAVDVLKEATQALIAGCVGLVNGFNPARLILGGGVIQGLPQLTEWIEQGVLLRALKAACIDLQVLPALLQNDAGVIGAAALAQRTFAGKKES